MMKIIKGRKYNTDTAEYIERVVTGQVSSETLYKKRTGEFFLEIWSGWGESTTTIKPISFEYAEKWAEKHLDGEKYEKIFGEVSEGEKTRITVWLSAADVDKIKRMAVEKSVSMSEMIEKLIEEK